MRTLPIVAALLAILSGCAVQPANEVDATIVNTPSVVLTNGPTNPVPVNLTVASPDDLFVHVNTLSLSAGENSGNKPLFTVPAGETLIIDYVNVLNASGAAPNGQETTFSLSYPDPDSLGFAVVSFNLGTATGIREAGGERVFLPVGPGLAVSCTLVRSDPSILSTYRITVTGRLIETP